MEFRTQLQPLGRRGEITHSTPLFLIGSCFTDSVGRLLRNELFATLVNPFGTIYNPASIAALLQRIADNAPFTQEELVEANGLYHSFLAHSSLSGTAAGDVVDALNGRLALARSFIAGAKVAIITLGTAYVYRLKAGGSIVSNCHKLPADRFTRSRLTPDEATRCIVSAVASLRELQPDIKVIFTVSPIRHTADGLHENQLSKSTLLLAIDMAMHQLRATAYFPAYEALMDDLRDYRFYATDMKHPSEVAVQYVHDLFAESFFTQATMQIARESLKLTKRLAHRRLAGTDKDYELFINETIKMASKLRDQHPELTDAITQYMTDYELYDK